MKKCCKLVWSMFFLLLTLLASIPVAGQEEIPDYIYASIPPNVQLSPGKDIAVNSDSLKVSVSFHGGGLIPDKLQFPNGMDEFLKERMKIYSQIPVVQQINLLWDGVVIASQKNTRGEAFGGVSFEFDLKDKLEGEYTLQAVAQWEGKETRKGPSWDESKEIIVSIDRTAPEKIDFHTLGIIGGYIDEAGIIQTEQRDIKLYTYVNDDVTSVIAKCEPFCIVERKLENNCLDISLTGLRMGETVLRLTLMDKAYNKTQMKFKIQRNNLR